MADKIYQLGQAEARLRHALGREATDEELAHELGVNLKKIVKLRQAALRPASLDAPLGEEGSSTVAEVIADENAATPFEHLRGASDAQLISKLVGQLPEREANIIRFRFGLGGGSERTLEDVICFVPVAIEYVFWEERLPEILVRFGQPTESSSADVGVTPKAWTEFFSGQLALTQDSLAAEALQRDPLKFRCLLDGRAGVGGIYDRWRAFRAALRGEVFNPEHGKL